MKKDTQAEVVHSLQVQILDMKKEISEMQAEANETQKEIIHLWDSLETLDNEFRDYDP